MFPNASLSQLDCIKSDHRPILFDTEQPVLPTYSNGSIKFEAKWLKEEGFREIVANAWNQAAADLP
jgi:hypothetical protein